jgi:hypothetical protein
MANPIGKKNPMLSMWLSAANAWAGAARNSVAAEARRSRKKAVAKAIGSPPARKKRRKS